MAKAWLALLRGVNVVGANQVPMKELAAAFERAGFRSVRTYIQSGNVVFASRSRKSLSLQRRIERLLLQEFALRPKVIVMSGDELAAAIKNNPFTEANKNHKSVHLDFLVEHPRDPDLESLTRANVGREKFELTGRVFYLCTPDGFAQSVLRSRIERCLGVAATARNWRTANELMKMLHQG
jgi:uncharacterized protein (DUF1697 family)